MSGASRAWLSRRAVATTAVVAVIALLPLALPSVASAASAPGRPAPGRLVSPTHGPAHAFWTEGTVSDLPAQTVTATVALTPPAGADAEIARLAGAASTPSRAARVAALRSLTPAASHRARVLAWARSAGLTVRSSDDWNVTVSGSAADMATAFSTSLVAAPSRFGAHGSASYLRPATTPLVPAALRSVARAVIGLDTRPLYAPRLAAANGLSATGFTGDQLRDAYAAPRDPAAGAGITVATVQFSGFHTSDLANYATAGDIPLFSGQVTSVSVDGANPTVPIGHSDEEVVLDTEAILASAPMARQRVYVAPNSGPGSIDAFTKIADDAVAGKIQVVSTSWGHCETALVPGEAAAIRAQVQRMVVAGATISASSGDNGNDDCGNATQRVDFPTSVPEIVSVGGTRLTSGYQTAWGGSGGGVSNTFGKPSYQSSLSGSWRHVPDIALLADPSSGFAISYEGGLVRVGGTSLSSPLFAGLLAGALSANGSTSGVGDIHSDLYAAPDKAFQDVVTGNNGFAAGVGYDDVTGVGAPRFGALAEALGIPAKARDTYHPIDPTRIADTRTGVGFPQARLGAGQSVSIDISSSAPGVPPSGVTAAVLNVTAVNPTTGTYLSVFPTGAAGGSATSAVNALPGVATPNLLTVKTNATGSITVYNFAGTVDVVLDLAGFYARDTSDLYTPVSPSRVLDTRTGIGVPQGKVGSGATVDLHVAGAGGLPPSGIDAVALNVTAVNATQGTFASVYPTGFAGGPLSSSLNIPSNKPVANLVITKVSSSGDVTFRNAFGSVDLVADVEGYYTTGGAQTFVPVSPVRVLDTRSGAPLSAGDAGSGAFLVAADQSRPGAVVLNLTGVDPTAYTFLSMFPINVPISVGKTSSTLNLNPGTVRANLAQTAVLPSGAPLEQLYNAVGHIDVVADIGGYFSAQPVLLPQTTVTLTAPATASFGTSVAFSATASAGGPAVATLAPGVRVTFVEPGSVGVRGSGLVAADGSASFSTTSLSVGTHTVYAVLAAHDGIAGSTSAPVTVTITP